MGVRNWYCAIMQFVVLPYDSYFLSNIFLWLRCVYISIRSSNALYNKHIMYKIDGFDCCKVGAHRTRCGFSKETNSYSNWSMRRKTLFQSELWILCFSRCAFSMRVHFNLYILYGKNWQEWCKWVRSSRRRYYIDFVLLLSYLWLKRHSQFRNSFFFHSVVAPVNMFHSVNFRWFFFC